MQEGKNGRLCRKEALKLSRQPLLGAGRGSFPWCREEVRVSPKAFECTLVLSQKAGGCKGHYLLNINITLIIHME